MHNRTSARAKETAKVHWNSRYTSPYNQLTLEIAKTRMNLTQIQKMTCTNPELVIKVKWTSVQKLWSVGLVKETHATLLQFIDNLIHYIDTRRNWTSQDTSLTLTQISLTLFTCRLALARILVLFKIAYRKTDIDVNDIITETYMKSLEYFGLSTSVLATCSKLYTRNYRKGACINLIPTTLHGTYKATYQELFDVFEAKTQTILTCILVSIAADDHQSALTAMKQLVQVS